MRIPQIPAAILTLPWNTNASSLYRARKFYMASWSGRVWLPAAVAFRAFALSGFRVPPWYSASTGIRSAPSIRTTNVSILRDLRNFSQLGRCLSSVQICVSSVALPPVCFRAFLCFSWPFPPPPSASPPCKSVVHPWLLFLSLSGFRAFGLSRSCRTNPVPF